MLLVHEEVVVRSTKAMVVALIELSAAMDFAYGSSA
jgi:hypothetical protein